MQSDGIPNPTTNESAQQQSQLPLSRLPEIAKKQPGERVAFRARVHHIRPLGAPLGNAAEESKTDADIS